MNKTNTKKGGISWQIRLTTYGIILAMVLLFCAFIYGAGWVFSSPSTATRTLQEAGMDHIQITGYRFFGCDEDVPSHTGFSATNPRGQIVTGTVCSGWFRGSTIHYD